MPASMFLEPTYKGYTNLNCPAYSFLIEHTPSNRKFLFDLGIRKDWENLSPYIVNRIKSGGWRLTIEKGVAEILQENGISPKEIEGIIWR